VVSTIPRRLHQFTKIGRHNAKPSTLAYIIPRVICCIPEFVWVCNYWSCNICCKTSSKLFILNVRVTLKLYMWLAWFIFPNGLTLRKIYGSMMKQQSCQNQNTWYSARNVLLGLYEGVAQSSATKISLDELLCNRTSNQLYFHLINNLNK
jgi:hypothetical protein